MSSHVKTIGIIGAGVSGLIAAKTFLEEGFDCEVFESKNSLGGVWENGYHSLHLQLPKESYEFLDWAMPQSYPEYPSCDQILSYLNSYARHFRIFEKIHFNCSVNKLERCPDVQGWRLSYYDKSSNTEQRREFDFLVVCNGLYSTPRMPSYPYQDQFKGRILHSSFFQDPELAKDSKVVVIGFGKSALDTAENAAQLTGQVTLVFRKAHWPLPRKFGGVLRSKVISSRFMSALLPLYQHPGRWERRLHTYGAWLVWGFWRFMEFLLRAQFRLKACGTLPPSRIEKDLFTGDFIASPDFYPLLRQGKIQIQQTTIKQFTPDGVDLSNGVHLSADTVVLGTGWQQDHSFLPNEYQSLVETDGLYLYRHILHPNIPRLAFVGLASTFNNSLSDYIESRWLVAMLRGDIVLPDEEYLLQEIEQMKEWKRRIMPPQRSRGSLLQVHVLHYHDELLRDMHINCKRKGNFVTELFSAYQPSDYKDILTVFLKRRSAPIRSEPDEKREHENRVEVDIDDHQNLYRQPGVNDPTPIHFETNNLEGADLCSLNLVGIDLSHKNLQSADLRRASLDGSNLRGADLRSADLSGAELKSAELFGANCAGAVLSRVNLERAFLIDSNLTKAYLNGANLTGAHLSGANLSGARLNSAQLTAADLSNANLADADLRGANLEGCDLSYANLKGADLSAANLSGAILLSADFENAEITEVKFDETETCKDIRINSANGNAMFKRFAQDQAYIEEYKINSPFRYFLWKYSSGCGRSLTLWVFWCIVIAIGFSLIFHLHLGGSESFLLSELAKDPDYDPQNWAPMLYYSVVTFTTLGFGDIVPRTQEAAWWIMAEVVMGYFMLGGLVTILATKIARRS